MRKEITLEEMRAIQLDMLIKVDAFCRKRGLRYSLGGGTLLGAVRHHGYIPWDDDIDIMMPRPDYEIFLKEFEVGSHLVVQSYLNDDTYSFLFAKVYDNRTVLIEEGAINGIYIDVFPIDGAPSEKDWYSYIEKMDKLQRQLQKVTKFYKFQNKKFLKLKYWIKYIYYPSREKTIKRLDSFFNSYTFEESLFAGAITGRYGKNELMSAEIFRNYTTMQFEGFFFSCITNYDSYLTKHYGDYMQIPSKEKQISNHSFIAYWK